VAGSHSNGDIRATGNNIFRFLLKNCVLGSTTEVGLQTNFTDPGMVASQKHDQIAGNHKTWKGAGTISTDSTIYASTAPSARLTPISATVKLISDGFRGGFFVPVNNGQTVTFAIALRKSVVGDGAAYNGNQPRLLVKSNVAIGINADTVLATADSASDGAWITYNGTTVAATDNGVMEFVVDCDGTAGWVNIDDIAITVT
jgi:hypothetical protein